MGSRQFDAAMAWGEVLTFFGIATALTTSLLSCLHTSRQVFQVYLDHGPHRVRDREETATPRLKKQVESELSEESEPRKLSLVSET